MRLRLCLKYFAMFAASVMVLTAFAGVSEAAGTEGEDSLAMLADSGGEVFGPGVAVESQPDGQARVRYLPTYQRWDGAWRPASVLDRAAGEWPYLVEETRSEIRVTRLGHTFTQAKIPGAVYGFQPLAIKETFVLSESPTSAIVQVPFSASLSMDTGAATDIGVVLRDASGRAVWRTEAFRAWDSSESPQTWNKPVTTLAYVDGRLRIGLDTAMLAGATYPLYVDPTWKLNATIGWGSSTFQDAVMDWGDHKVKLGWLADNFDDNTNEIWTVTGGSLTLSGGRATLSASALITAEGSWSDLRLGSTVNFARSAVLTQFFRYQDSQNRYALEIAYGSQSIKLKKMIGGSTTLISPSLSVSISTNTDYKVKIVAHGNDFEIWWAGSRIWTGTDGNPPGTPLTGKIGFALAGKATAGLDDVRVWDTEIGSMTTAVRHSTQFPQLMRTVHTGGTYAWVDLQIFASDDNVTWRGPHYVKAGAEPRLFDAEGYFIQDADRELWYRARIDLRATDDSTPSVSELAVFEGGIAPSENSQLLGYEPWQDYARGMVNVVNGNLILRERDLSLPGKGWALSLDRSYNSLSTVPGPLGTGWTHSYNIYLTAGSGFVDFTDGDRSTHRFDDLGGGAFASPRGLGGTKLIRNMDGTYAMFVKDGSKWSFSSAGKLTEMKDRNWNRLSLTYNAYGQLAKVADDSGLFLLFAYGEDGKLAAVGDHNVTQGYGGPTAHAGSWSNGQNAFANDGLWASTSAVSATHRYGGYSVGHPSGSIVTKVEVCLKGHADADDDIGVKVSADSGVTWSTEQIVNLQYLFDNPFLTCLDFTAHQPSWSWIDVSTELRVEVRYVKVGGQASSIYLNWLPIRLTFTARGIAYDYTAGDLASVSDPLGRQTWYRYAGMLEKAIDRANRSLRFVSSWGMVDEVWTGEYDRSMDAIKWEFLQYSLTYTSWGLHRTDVRDALGNLTRITYDRLAGRPTDIEGPLAALGIGCSCIGQMGGERWIIEWDGEHNWVARADALGGTTTATYDWRGNALLRTDAMGNSTESVWNNRDELGLFDSTLGTLRNERGFLTRFEYDLPGNLVKMTDALGNVTRTFYAFGGFVNKTVDARGFNRTFGYDSHGWLANTTDPLGHVTRQGYDALGRVVTSPTATGLTIRRSYAVNDRITSDSNSLGFTTRYEYNDRGDMIAVVDANGNRTTYEINVTWGRTQRMVPPTGHATEYAYDILGRLVETKDPNGRIWRYEYDAFGRRTTETDPLGQVTRLSYDAAGNIATRIDGNGRYTNYTYDPLNRLIRASYQGGDILTYGYDAASNVVFEGGYGFTKATSYDALDRVSSMTFDFGPFSRTVAYTYDETGKRRTMVYPDGLTLTYTWDADGRLASMGVTGQTWTFLYDAEHRRTAARHPNGLELNATFDDANRLTSVRTKHLSNGTDVENYTYAYDKLANRKTMGQINGTQLGYAYSDDYALTATTYEMGATADYSYDPNDNRLYRNESAGSQTKYLYNDDSSLDRREVRWLGDLRVTNDYAYDENGNRVWNLENIIGRGLTTYTYEYDLEDRLVRILSDSYEMVSYAYFNDGSRVRRTASSGSTYFLYDFQDFNGYADIIAEYDSAGMLKARYIHGPGIDEPLAKEYAGQWYYYHADGLGSVTMLTRADKTVANRYVYDDYGAFRSRTEAIPNPYAYTGREYDSAVDLIYYRARYYDAITGRFLTRDPQGMDDGPNVYTYARNNPTSRTDPSGTRFSDKDPFFNPFAPDPGGPGLGGGDKADCKVGEQGRGHGYGKCKDRGDGNPPPPPPPPAATPPPRDIQWGLVVAGIALLAVCLIFLWFVAPFIMGLLATIWSAAQAATEASVFASLLFIGGVTVGMLFIIPCGGAVWLILVGFNFV